MAEELEDGSMVMDDGTIIRLGCLQPEVLRFAAVPAWDEANDVLPESQWVEHDDLAEYSPPIKYQRHNNCTNAALAGGMETAINAAYTGDRCPELSMSMLYSIHNGGRDAGAFCRDLAASVSGRGGGKVKGLCRASLWPESKIYASERDFTPEILADAEEHMAFEVYQCMDWTHVASALSRRFIIYHGFVMGNAWTQTGSDGMAPEFDGRLAAGHAMYSRGLRRTNGKWRSITPNTWSVQKGDKGVYYWPASYFWGQRGNFVNLDAYAIRAVKINKPLPKAA